MHTRVVTAPDGSPEGPFHVSVAAADTARRHPLNSKYPPPPGVRRAQGGMPWTHAAPFFNQPHPLLPHDDLGYMLTVKGCPNLLVAPSAGVVRSRNTLSPFLSLKSDVLLVNIDNEEANQWAVSEGAGKRKQGSA